MFFSKVGGENPKNQTGVFKEKQREKSGQRKLPENKKSTRKSNTNQDYKKSVGRKSRLSKRY